MMDDKYIVYKRGSSRGDLPLTDCFVLRPSDMFASAALWGYAHLVQTQLEVARQRPGTFSDDECKRMKDLAKMLASKAAEWQTIGTTKVPD